MLIASFLMQLSIQLVLSFFFNYLFVIKSDVLCTTFPTATAVESFHCDEDSLAKRIHNLPEFLVPSNRGSESVKSS